jgi:SAM-dependent methyltransferase
MTYINTIDNKYYSNYKDNWDDRLLRQQVLKYVDGTSKVLDLGAGAGVVEEMNFRSQVGKVYGLDPDQRVLENPYLDEARIGVGEKIPYPDSTFDHVIANNLLEHLVSPEKVLLEVSRVLKPGGFFHAKTPNKYHYVSLIARITPHVFHEYVNVIRGRDRDDTFPTKYKLNTENDIKKYSNIADLEVCEIRHVEGRPEYMRVNTFTYILGCMYERVVNSSSLFRKLRVVLLVRLKKAPQDRIK